MGLKDTPVFSFNGLFCSCVRVAKVYDGDTVTLVAPIGLRDELRRINTRLLGVDACELKGKNRSDGVSARTVLVDALGMPNDGNEKYDEAFFDANPTHIDAWFHGNDKYGRPLVELAPCGSSPVNMSLCESEHFAPYNGKGARPIQHTHDTQPQASPETSHEPAPDPGKNETAQGPEPEEEPEENCQDETQPEPERSTRAVDTRGAQRNTAPKSSRRQRRPKKLESSRKPTN